MPKIITVSAAESTVQSDLATIEQTTGIANITVHARQADGRPFAGMAVSGNIVVSSTGTGNTITAVDTVTNQDGRARFTFSSTVAQAKTISATIRGTVVTQTAAVTVGSGSVTFEFTSDWSTATGTSDAALRDTGKAIPWTSLNGTNTNRSVDASTGLDFPSTNVLRVGTQWNGSGSASFIPRLTDVLSVPGVGDSKYYRWYIKWVVPTSVPTWGTPHPIQDGPDGANYNWELEARRGTGGLKVSPMWTPSGATFPNNRWAALDALDIDETYRFELQLTRTGTTTYTLNPRVYDSSNVLILDASDFRNQTGVGSTTLDSGFEFTFNDTEWLRDFQVGTNGAFQGTTSSDHPVDYVYQGCVAISANTWCGPYTPGEAP